MADSGRLVAERYLLHEPVGRGGMGVVWRADDQLLGRCVAVKEVHLQPGLSDDEREAVQRRVVREARAAAGIDHGGAVTVFDVVEDHGQAYIVMELVDAPTLADLVAERGPLPPAQVARIGLAVLDVLAVAHERGIVHRDLKPANVMVLDDDRVKLTDFGIATIKDDPRLTSSGIVLGSPSYISPEQALGRPVTGDTDLWGLGASMYFAVCGHPPFDRGEALATVNAVAHDELDVEPCAGALAPVLQAMLTKSPADRPSVGELRSSLAAVAAGTAAPTPPPALGDTRALTVVAPRPEALPLRSDEPLDYAAVAPRERRRRGAWLLVPLALIAVVALLAVRPGADDPSGTPDRAAGTSVPPASSADAPGAEDAAEEGVEPDAGNGDAGSESPGGAAELVDYTHPVAGYTVRYPRGWEVVRRDAATTDFREPRSGRYLRVGWTSTPGDDPAQAWRDQAEHFRSRYEDYREIRIDETEFRGHEAAVWEWTYRVNRDLHAINLGWVDGDRGYALNFQTPAERWDESQGLWEAFQRDFRTP